MKYFTAVESARAIKGQYSFKIYQIKKNQMIFIWIWSIKYGLTRGAESEVMSELACLGYIPKKYVRGYYHCGYHYPLWVHNPPNTITFNIKYIVPANQK